jgi:hypothetical protein
MKKDITSMRHIVISSVLQQRRVFCAVFLLLLPALSFISLDYKGSDPSDAGASSHARVLLEVDSNKRVAVVTFPTVSAESRYIVLEDGRKTLVPFGENRYRWSLEGGADLNHPNRLLVYLQRDGGLSRLGVLEVLKQSEEVLFRKFRFRQRDGYVLVGRSDFAIDGPRKGGVDDLHETLQICDALDAAERARVRKWFPKLHPVQPDTSSWGQIANATEVLSALYAIMPATGPSNLLDGTETPSKTLDMMVNHGASLQCTGIRDLFVGVALSCGMLSADCIRKVDAWRYEAIDNVVVNGHSCLSIRAKGGKWFLFDPLVRAVFLDRSGTLLAAADIRQMRRDGRLGEIVVHDLPVRASAPPYPREVIENREPSAYNYWCHFNRTRFTYLQMSAAY